MYTLAVAETQLGIVDIWPSYALMFLLEPNSHITKCAVCRWLCECKGKLHAHEAQCSCKGQVEGDDSLRM